MALVRRDNLLGKAAGMVAAAVSHAPAPAVVGRAPVPASAHPGADNGGGAVAAVAAGPIPSPGGEAAAVPTQPASLGAIMAAFGLVAAGGAGSWMLWRSGNTPQGIQLQDATTVFAALFAFATAVERLLEPFARWLPGAGSKAEFESAVASMANQGNASTYESLSRVAAAKSKLERGRANRMLVAWGIATAVSTVAASAGGFYLLHAIAGPGWNGVATWIDAIVTGVVVGSGTKPLHDVISRVQKTKEKQEDPTH
jgi:hypothetical protein